MFGRSMKRIFVGFGLGPIQAGLFLSEAQRSGAFDRLVVIEINPILVKAVRENKEAIQVNIDHADRLETQQLGEIEIYNPNAPADLQPIRAALNEASEIATALPSIDAYSSGSPSIAELLAEALDARILSGDPHSCIIYTA